jgi:tetratricopeptide (TPR) repeat protein
MLQAGTLIDGKYSVIRSIGEGGMGVVYEATHVKIGRRVAVKVLQSGLLRYEPDALQRFQREALAAGRIETEHIVQLFDAGYDVSGGLPYIAMEFLDGRDLESALEKEGPLAPEAVARIAAQTLLGLEKAHTAGVIHRDIKSANIFLAKKEANAVTVKLLDFGIAKVRAENTMDAATKSGALMGSVEYLSPEQAMGSPNTDHRTDLWSLGVVMYEALTGRTPHSEHKVLPRILMAICQSPPRPVRQLAPWVPSNIAEVVDRALQIDLRIRFVNARAMLDALLRALPGGVDLTASMIRSHTAPDLPVIPAPPNAPRVDAAMALLQRAQKDFRQAPVVVEAAEPPKPLATDHVFQHLADIYRFLGRWDALAEVYTSRLRKGVSKPERKQLAHELAVIFGDKLNDPERAVSQLLGLLTREPQDAKAGNDLARFAQGDRLATAVQSMNEALAVEREPARAAYLCLRLADLHAQGGYPQLADEFVLRAMRLGSSDCRALHQAAAVYRRVQIFDGAKRALKRAVEAATTARERAESYHALGEVYEQHENDLAAARENYTRARVEDPGFNLPSEALARIGQ